MGGVAGGGGDVNVKRCSMHSRAGADECLTVGTIELLAI